MSVLLTNARPATGRIASGVCCKAVAEAKRIGSGVVRGGQMDPQTHAINPCDPGGPGL